MNVLLIATTLMSYSFFRTNAYTKSCHSYPLDIEVGADNDPVVFQSTKATDLPLIVSSESWIDPSTHLIPSIDPPTVIPGSTSVSTNGSANDRGYSCKCSLSSFHIGVRFSLMYAASTTSD